MSSNPITIKEDMNFLDYPNWIVSNKETSTVLRLTMKNDNGFYEMKSPEGLPGRFDKVVLYFLIYKMQDNPIKSSEVVTTRYEIAKNVLFQEKNFSKTKYDRIMLALKRWKAIYIKFEGIFFERDNHTIKYFSILDFVSLDKKTNKLSIKFNDQYMKQLEESNFYRMINFHEYKKLTRPVSARLYEILTREFSNSHLWCVDVMELGERLTLEKRFFPSHILGSVTPALEEINQNSTMSISFDYDKKRLLCIFKKNPSIPPIQQPEKA